MRRALPALAGLLMLLAGPMAEARERIVTLAPHLAELVCAAGGCGELVGVGAYTDYPAEAAKVAVVGDVVNINYERLLALQPTRVYVWDGGTPEAHIAKLRSLKLPVQPVRVDTLEQVGDRLRELGQQLGHAAEGEAAARKYQAALSAMRARYADARKLKVFYQIETDPAYTVNGQSPISQVIALCGGSNPFASLPTLAAPVSVEAVLAAGPDAVLHSERDSRAIRRYWSRFASATVSRYGTIYGVDANLVTRSGPRLVEGAATVCAALDHARAVLKN